MNPTLIAVIFHTVGQETGIDPKLLQALCYVESNLRPSAIRHDDGHGDSLGWCQVKHATAQFLGYTGTAEGLRDPIINATYAAKYLKYQLGRYDGDTHRAVAAYNSGTYRERDGRAINCHYINKVFKEWAGGSSKHCKRHSGRGSFPGRGN